MTYQPVIPTGGNLGWAFLNRTRESQKSAFDNSATIKSDTTYFREKIGSVETAEALVSDRRLLAVALGAFGLEDDIANKYFVQKVLEEGALDPESFSNRLADKRYMRMAEAFAFDLSPPNTALSNFANDILKEYTVRQFEVAVGTQDEDLRLALGVEREIASLAQRDLREDSAWFVVMGNPPMRRVFEKALGLPSQIAAVDIDQQLKTFREKSFLSFGVSDPQDFEDPEMQAKLVRKFLFRVELDANTVSTSGGAVALSLLRSQKQLL